MNYCNPLWETVFHNDIIWICMVLAAYSSWLTFPYHNLGQSSHFWQLPVHFWIWDKPLWSALSHSPTSWPHVADYSWNVLLPEYVYNIDIIQSKNIVKSTVLVFHIILLKVLVGSFYHLGFHRITLLYSLELRQCWMVWTSIWNKAFYNNISSVYCRT